MRRLPVSARARSLISQAAAAVAFVDMDFPLLFEIERAGSNACPEILLPSGCRHRRIGLQGLGLISSFPAEGVFGAAKVAERRGFPVDRAAQAEMFDHALRREREVRANQIH